MKIQFPCFPTGQPATPPQFARFLGTTAAAGGGRHAIARARHDPLASFPGLSLCQHATSFHQPTATTLQ